MKKVLTRSMPWVILFGCLLVPGLVSAQTQDSVLVNLPKPMLKTVPLHFEEINVAVEKFHRPNRSVQYGAGFIYRSMSNGGSFGEPVGKDVNGLALRVSYRSYWEKRFASPQGGYHGPLVTYRYMTFPREVYFTQFNQPQTLKLRQQVFALQYLMGMQRVFKDWLVVDAFMGLGARLKYATKKDSGAEPGVNMDRSQLYGVILKAGPDWILLAGPSVSFNIAVGVVL